MNWENYDKATKNENLENYGKILVLSLDVFNQKSINLFDNNSNKDFDIFNPQKSNSNLFMTQNNYEDYKEATSIDSSSHPAKDLSSGCPGQVGYIGEFDNPDNPIDIFSSTNQSSDSLGNTIYYYL